MSSKDIVSLALKAGKTFPKYPQPDPTISLQAIISAWKEYQQVREREETQREAIREQARVAIEAIRTQASLLGYYFDKSFDERKENFQKSFALLEKALNEGDSARVDAALSIILTQIKESPAKQAAEAIQQIRSASTCQIIDL